MSELTAAVGIVCVTVAIALLADWRWALLELGLVLIVSGYAQYTHELAEPTVAPVAEQVSS